MGIEKSDFLTLMILLRNDDLYMPTITKYPAYFATDYVICSCKCYLQLREENQT